MLEEERGDPTPQTTEQVVTAEDLEGLIERNDDGISNPDRREDPNAVISQEDLDMQNEFQDVMYKGAIHKGTQYIGDRGLGDSQWDDGATYQEITTEGGLAKRRAALQPWTDQAVNAVTQAVVAEGLGGTIEGVGYLMDWEGIYGIAKGTEKEYSNWFSELGSKLKETVQDNTAIYERSPGEIDMFDTGFWFKNAVSIASTLSIMIPGVAGAKMAKYMGKFLAKTVAKTVNAGAKVLGKGHIAKEAAEKGVQLGARATWMTDGVTQAVVSRHIENTMEAKGTMDTVMQARMAPGVINPKTGLAYTEEEARMDAAEAASKNYKQGWLMLGQDMFQYLSIGKVFNPITKQMEVANRIGKATILGTKAKRAISIGASFASEAAEEGYQNFISSNAHLQVDYNAGLITEQELARAQFGIMGSDEAKISMLFGGLGGSVFDFAGPKVNELMKSKSRKEMEAKAEEWNKMNFADQFSFYSSLHKKKQQAESAGDVAGRQMVQDDIITAMIIDGIDNDNLESVMEGILAGKDMSAEEQEAFKEQHGAEWNQELAEQGADRALEMAQEIKQLHFKNRSKKANKGVPESIIKAQTMAEFQTKNLTKEQERLSKESQDIYDNIKFDENNKPTQEWLDSTKTNLDVVSQNVYINVLKKLHSEATGKNKEMLGEQLKVARAQKRKLKRTFKTQQAAQKEASSKLAKEQREQDSAATKDMTPSQKKKYMADRTEEAEARAIVDKNNKEAYAAAEQEVITNSVEQKINGVKIVMNNSKQKTLASKEHHVEVKKNNIKGAIGQLTTDKHIEGFRKKISKDDFVGNEYTAEERAELEKMVDERADQIKKEEERKKKEEENKAAAAELAKKTKEKNSDTTVPDNNVSNEVADVLEDQHKDEEVQTEENVAAKEEHTLEVKTGNGKAFAPLDNSQGTLKAYKMWLLDGTSKIGQVVGYRVANRGPHKNPRSRSTSKAYQAIVEFDAAMREFKSTGVMPQLSDLVLDHYPIELYVKDGSENGDKKKVTDVASLDSSRKSEEQIQRYKESTRPERAAILNSLLQGKEPLSVVTHTGGGQLKTDTNSDGSKAINGIREVEQFRDPESDITIMYTNERGELMQSDKKDLHPDFIGTKFSAGKDDADNSRPYSGGVFILVKKADGTSFPVKVNNLKNTQGQSEVLADLLMGIAIPPGQKDKTTGEYPAREFSMDTAISELPQEMQDRINAEFAPEMELLGSEAKLTDLLGLTTYLSDKTDGMNTSLMFKGVRLMFGAQGTQISPENNSEQLREELVDFLRDVKSRPFSLERWNNTSKHKGYRNYVLENNVINTDMTKSGPLFESSTPGPDGKVERRVQIYLEPLAPKTKKQSTTGKNLAEVTETANSEDLVDDPTVAEPKFSVEANKEIADKFPGMNYHFGIHDGKTVFGVTIPDADLKAIKEIQDKFAAKGKTVISNVSTSNKAAQVAAHAAEEGSTFTTDGKNLDGTKGFSVSTHVDLTKSIPGKEITEQDIADFIEANKMLLGVDPSLSIGTWYNEKTNTSMIDVVSIEPDLNKAIALGEKHNQIAIYSLSAGHAINTGGTGQSGKVDKQVAKRQEMVDKRSKRFTTIIENNPTIEEKAEAVTSMMNTVAASGLWGLTADSKTLAALDQAISELEKEGYELRRQIGREISDNENYEVASTIVSDNVPEGVSVINNIRTPIKRDSNGVIISLPKYDIIVGSGTSTERNELVQELRNAEDALDPSNMEGTRARFDIAKAALRKHDARVYPKENRIGKDDGSNTAAVEKATKADELQDAREQLDFAVDFLESDGSLDLNTKKKEKRAAQARYVEKVSDINSKYAIENSKPEAKVEAVEVKENKTPDMNVIESEDSNVQFSLFDNTWDATVNGETIASNVSKEDAVEKVNDHKEKSEKLDSKSATVNHTVNGKTQTYSVNDGVITNSKGKEVFAKNGKNRTAILDSAQKNLAKLEKTLEPVVPVDLTDQEWQDFIMKGFVSETRLRALVAKEESGAVMDLKEQTILDGKLGRIETGKGNVSENGDAKISKANKKVVSSQTEGNTKSKLHSKEVSFDESTAPKSRRKKKNQTEAIESEPPTNEQINGVQEEGKEDTEHC